MNKMNTCCTFRTCMILYLISLTGCHVTSGVHEAFMDLSDFVSNCSAVRYKMPPQTIKRINMTFEPFQILYVDERSQATIVSSLITLMWLLDECQWSPASYSGIYKVDIDTSMLWMPSVAMPKGTISPALSLPSTVTLTSDGQVKMLIPGPVATMCFLNLDRYPFDHHNCTVPFIVMNSDGLFPVGRSNLLYNLDKYFSTSAEWKLLSSGCALIQTTTLNYTECWFTMERLSTFYIAILIFPIILMSAMTLLVFCIPAESGEKLSYVISIFVAMTMFINFIIDVIPRSMAQLPRVVRLILAVLVKIALTTAVTAGVLKKYTDERARRSKGEVKVHPAVCQCPAKLTAMTNVRPTAPKNDPAAGKTVLLVKTSGNEVEADQVKDGALGQIGFNPTQRTRCQGQALTRGKHLKFKLNISSKDLDNIFFCIFLVSDIAIYTIILI